MTETEAMWSERVAAWKASGQSSEAFTRGEPYAPSTLRWWSSRLRRRVEAKSTAPARAEAKRKPCPVAMVKVVRTSEPAALVVEVGRARILVGERFDASLLARVVAALGET